MTTAQRIKLAEVRYDDVLLTAHDVCGISVGDSSDVSLTFYFEDNSSLRFCDTDHSITVN